MDFPMPGKGQCALMVIKEAKSMKRVTIREGFGAGVYPMDHNPGFARLAFAAGVPAFCFWA